jgi:hypothetical protein
MLLYTQFAILKLCFGNNILIIIPYIILFRTHNHSNAICMRQQTTNVSQTTNNTFACINIRININIL